MQRTQGYQQHRSQYQNRNYCCEGHMIIGFILSLTSAILLWVELFQSAPIKSRSGVELELTIRTLVSVSLPLIKQITSLNTPSYRYGAFGYCRIDGDCIHTTGYSTGPEIREWMTETVALFPLGTSIQYIIARSLDQEGELIADTQPPYSCSSLG